MKLFLLLALILNSCYLAEKKKYKDITLDLQIDPILKLEKTDLIYINASALPNEIRSRWIVHYFKNALVEKGYKITADKNKARVIVNIEKTLNKVTLKDTKRVITEEITINKKVYIKERDTFQEEPKTTTKYKEVPYEYSRSYVNIKFSFCKIIDKKPIDIIKTYIEENRQNDFQELLEKSIYKLVDYIDLDEERRRSSIIVDELE